jgi:hypothetical protein
MFIYKFDTQNRCGIMQGRPRFVIILRKFDSTWPPTTTFEGRQVPPYEY